jgi:calcineurin-like phosphoesterase family protein
MNFFTSDLHIGDKTIARWRGFDSVEAHDELIVSRLCERLGADDELWILGDICKPTVAAARELREVIPCERVHVVIGNHDTGSKFVTCGGYVSVDYYAQVGKVAREGYKFVMSHYPMLDWDRAFHGSYMLHGHIHSLPAEGGPAGLPAPADRANGGFGLRGYNEWNREHGIRRYDVGVDANGYQPVSAEQIVAFFPDDARWRAMHGMRG